MLDACLESLAFVDEIVVVDSASSDSTAEIAARRRARVVQKEWLGFGRQKQFAVDQAKHDWVLCIDADERVSPQLAASIQRALTAPVSPVYRMPRRNRFLQRRQLHAMLGRLLTDSRVDRIRYRRNSVLRRHAKPSAKQRAECGDVA